jgi:hypothetical protein
LTHGDDAYDIDPAVVVNREERRRRKKEEMGGKNCICIASMTVNEAVSKWSAEDQRRSP